MDCIFKFRDMNIQKRGKGDNERRGRRRRKERRKWRREEKKREFLKFLVVVVLKFLVTDASLFFLPLSGSKFLMGSQHGFHMVLVLREGIPILSDFP